MDVLPQFIVNSLIVGSLYALIALGFSLQYAATRLFNIAYGAMILVGGYAMLALMNHFDWPMPVSVAVSMGIAGSVSLIMYGLVFRWLYHRKASSLVMLIVSLGAFTVIQAVIAILFTSQFQSLTQAGQQPVTYQLLGAVFSKVQLFMLLAVVVVWLACWLVLRFTRVGKAIRAMADDEEVAWISGVPVKRLMMMVFFSTAMIAGLAGILVGFDTGLEPTAGFPLFLKGVIAAIIGGIGNPGAAVLGGFVLGIVENFGIWHIAGQWKDPIAFAVLMGFLLFRPQGLISRK